MREIKFRIWVQETKDKTDFDRMYLSDEYKTLSEFFREYENISKESDKFSLMQYTGLKDRNGKEIYEGDIVRWISISTRSQKIDEVRWVNRTGYYPFGKTAPNRMFIGDKGEFRTYYEVIGNIYENPELLQDK